MIWHNPDSKFWSATKQPYFGQKCWVYRNIGTTMPKGIFNLLTIIGTLTPGSPKVEIEPATFQSWVQRATSYATATWHLSETYTVFLPWGLRDNEHSATTGQHQEISTNDRTVLHVGHMTISLHQFGSWNRQQSEVNINVCKTLMPPFPNIWTIGFTVDLDLWPTDLNINRGHLLIKDYLPTNFEGSGAKRSRVIRRTRWSRLA